MPTAKHNDAFSFSNYQQDMCHFGNDGHRYQLKNKSMYNVSEIQHIFFFETPRNDAGAPGGYSVELLTRINKKMTDGLIEIWG